MRRATHVFSLAVRHRLMVRNRTLLVDVELVRHQRGLQIDVLCQTDSVQGPQVASRPTVAKPSNSERFRGLGTALLGVYCDAQPSACRRPACWLETDDP